MSTRSYDHPILDVADAPTLARWSGIYTVGTIRKYLRRPRSKMPARFRKFMAGLIRKPEQDLFREKRA